MVVKWQTSRDPNLKLVLGDNVYNERTDSEHQDAVFDMYPTALRSTVVLPTVGNQEARQSLISNNETGPYYDIFWAPPRAAEAGGVASGTEAYDSFDYGNIHFVCLESYEVSRSAGGAMMTKLEADMAAKLQPWTIAFWHHPPWHQRCRWGCLHRGISGLQGRRAFRPLDLVFSGAT